MIQRIHDLFITGSAHAATPPPPDRTGDAPHRHGDPTSPRKRGEVNPLKLVRKTSESRHSVSARSSIIPSVCCESQFFPGRPRLRGEVKYLHVTTLMESLGSLFPRPMHKTAFDGQEQQIEAVAQRAGGEDR